MAVPRVKLRERKDTKGTSYFIDYTVNGKRYRKSAGTNRKTALEISQNIQAKLTLGIFDVSIQAENSISLDELIKNFLSHKRNHIQPSSLKRYRNYLDKFLEYMNKFFPAVALNIRDIKTSYIDESFNHFLENEITNNKQWNPKTVNGLRTVLIQLFNYGIKQDQLSVNPAKETKKFRENGKNVVEFFSEDELEQLWEELDGYWVDPLKFIFHTGLRKGELINLKWKNVNLKSENPSIVIESSDNWKTKTGESRVISLNKTALEILERQKGKSKEYVFVQKNGTKIHPDRPYHAIKKALKNLGLDGDIHKLRHTFASRLVMKGESLYTVSKLLGHSDTKTTEIYAHLAPDYLKSAVDKLDENS